MLQTTSYRVSTGVRADQGESVKISIPNVQMEIDVKPGKDYDISAATDETGRSEYERSILGRSTVTTSSRFSVKEADWVNPEVPRKCLVPYDSSIPVTLQAILKIPRGIYVVGFDGEPVCWGWGKSGERERILNIGVPPGSHTLQLVKGYDSTLYTKNINCTPGSIYGINWEDVNWKTVKDSFRVAKDAQTLNVADGPSVTMYVDGDGNFSHIYISPVEDTSWGLNRLKPGQFLNAKEDITLQLPKSPKNRYDILLIRKTGTTIAALDFEVVTGSKIGCDVNGIFFVSNDGKKIYYSF